MRTLRAGSIIGIPLHINPGWFVICGLTIWVLAARVFPEILPDAGRRAHIAMAVVSAALFFLSIILHELAHSIVARRYGIPVRSITLFVFGGVAHITREASRPLNELIMAAAGPLLSLVLGGAFLAVWWIAGGGADSPWMITLVWSGWMNIVLGVFNFLPAFPMDGGRILRSLIWLLSGSHDRATVVAAWTGRGFGWAMMALGAATVAGFDVFLAASPLGGIWFILIGAFLENGARQSLVQAGFIRALSGFSARDLMLADPPVADASLTVGGLARGVFELNPRVCYFIEDRGALAGLLSVGELRHVPPALWERVTASEAMVPSDRLRPMAPDASASDVLMALEDEGLMHTPVVDEGRAIGIIGRDRIVTVLRQAGLLDARHV